ncbi:OstA-like protein [Flavimarina sp. Hel_I_48]|uniref:OstA-like protein n=1 Tax=Flavimarina sp. Hel_I_48 TaxID=1392488 RepID=UPI0009DD12CA|nr:OstA-like protein [Flavimarina sp. Hel_I_48]
MPKLKKVCFSLIFLLFHLISLAQDSPKKGKEIRIDSDLEEIDEATYPGALIMRKMDNQVYIQHEGIKMWCDLAFHYQEENFVKAYGNVRINQGDTITMTSRYAEYNGDTQFAYASGQVDMQSPTATLSTDTLYMDRIKQEAFYRSGGTLKDTASTVVSKIGRYFMEQDKYSFIQDVVLTNPEYVIDSEQLDYFSNPGHAYLYGPSTITSDSSVVYCERGFYDTHADIGYFVKNSRIDYDNRTVYGDSLYFDRNNNFASATNNIKVVDTANNSVIRGHYAEVYKAKDSVFITKRAVAITKQENDSIYIHGNRLVVTGKPDDRIVRAYPNVRIFKKDMSGKSDSLVSDQHSGLTKMLGNPILWNGRSQMTGDTIHLKSDPKTDKLDSLKVFDNAFIAQQDSIALSSDPQDLGYNQVSGKTLYGMFKENQLYQVDVVTNAESIIYQRSEEGILQSIDKGKSASLQINFEDQEIVEVTKRKDVVGNAYPLSKFPKKERSFPGLNWRGDEEILKKEDIFKGDQPYELAIIKGIPPPQIEEDFFATNNEDKPQELPEVSELNPEDLENREEDAPKIGIPVNDKATIQRDSLAPQVLPQPGKLKKEKVKKNILKNRKDQ